MYVPAHFKPDDGEVLELLGRHAFADLVTVTGRGMLATPMPFLHDRTDDRPDVGPWGVLVGHLARNNEQWREPAQGQALVIVRGPDAYISPGWYAATREHGRVVPTWNYITAHVYGRLVIHDDPAWVDALVRRLTDRFEAHGTPPWSVDDAPRAYIVGQLRAIVGIEVMIERVEGKLKLGQNRSDADIEGAVAGLRATGSPELADAMEAARRSSPR